MQSFHAVTAPTELQTQFNIEDVIQFYRILATNVLSTDLMLSVSMDKARMLYLEYVKILFNERKPYKQPEMAKKMLLDRMENLLKSNIFLTYRLTEKAVAIIDDIKEDHVKLRLLFAETDTVESFIDTLQLIYDDSNPLRMIKSVLPDKMNTGAEEKPAKLEFLEELTALLEQGNSLLSKFKYDQAIEKYLDAIKIIKDKNLRIISYQVTLQELRKSLAVAYENKFLYLFETEKYSEAFIFAEKFIAEMKDSIFVFVAEDQQATAESCRQYLQKLYEYMLKLGAGNKLAEALEAAKNCLRKSNQFYNPMNNSIVVACARKLLEFSLALYLEVEKSDDFSQCLEIAKDALYCVNQILPGDRTEQYVYHLWNFRRRIASCYHNLGISIKTDKDKFFECLQYFICAYKTYLELDGSKKDEDSCLAKKNNEALGGFIDSMLPELIKENVYPQANQKLYALVCNERYDIIRAQYLRIYIRVNIVYAASNLKDHLKIAFSALKNAERGLHLLPSQFITAIDNQIYAQVHRSLADAYITRFFEQVNTNNVTWIGIASFKKAVKHLLMIPQDERVQNDFNRFSNWKYTIHPALEKVLTKDLDSAMLNFHRNFVPGIKFFDKATKRKHHLSRECIETIMINGLVIIEDKSDENIIQMKQMIEKVEENFPDTLYSESLQLILDTVNKIFSLRRLKPALTQSAERLPDMVISHKRLKKV
jgi:hypothetical protein